MNFLLQVVKDGSVEELPQGDVQSVAEFLDGGHGGAVISSADDVVERGLGYAAEGRQPVDGDLPLGTEFQDSGAHRCMTVDTASHPNAKGLV